MKLVQILSEEVRKIKDVLKDSSTVTDEPTHTSKPSHKPPTAKHSKDAVAPNFDEILVDVDIHEPHGDDSIGSIEEFLPLAEAEAMLNSNLPTNQLH